MNFIHLPNEGIWRKQISPQGFEVLVAGDAQAPSVEHLDLLEQIQPQLESLRQQATRYLDFWLNPKTTGGSGEDWFFESLDLSHQANRFVLAFSLPSDTYGYWEVGFGVGATGFWIESFSRLQQ